MIVVDFFRALKLNKLRNQPELLAAGQLLLLLPSSIDGVFDLVQRRWIRGQIHPPLPPCCNEHGSDLCQRATDQFFKPVSSSPGQEHNQSQHNGTSTYPISPLPAPIILNVNKNCHSSKWSNAYQEEEPIEENRRLRSLLLIRFVELIGTEPRNARFQATGAECR